MTNSPQRLSQLIQQAQALQAGVAGFQDTMSRTEVTGTAAGGDVAVSMTAAGDFLSVHLDPGLVEDGPVGELEGLILAALRDAMSQLRDYSAERTGSLITMLEGLRGH